MAGQAVVKRTKGLAETLFRAPSSWLQSLYSLIDLLPWSRRPAARPKAELSEADTFRHMAFTFAVIALAAKVSKCDGGITRDEFLAFREIFPLEDDESKKIRRLFQQAWEDEADAEYYARQACYLFPDSVSLWRELVKRLSAIAIASGPLTPNKLRLLNTIGEEFGFRRAQMARMISNVASGQEDPFHILGLPRNATLDEVRRQYRELMRLYHPDAAQARLSYPEAIAVAERKAAAINGAYREALEVCA